MHWLHFWEKTTQLVNFKELFSQNYPKIIIFQMNLGITWHDLIGFNKMHSALSVLYYIMVDHKGLPDLPSQERHFTVRLHAVNTWMDGLLQFWAPMLFWRSASKLVLSHVHFTKGPKISQRDQAMNVCANSQCLTWYQICLLQGMEFSLFNIDNFCLKQRHYMVSNEFSTGSLWCITSLTKIVFSLKICQKIVVTKLIKPTICYISTWILSNYPMTVPTCEMTKDILQQSMNIQEICNIIFHIREINIIWQNVVMRRNPCFLHSCIQHSKFHSLQIKLQKEA